MAEALRVVGGSGVHGRVAAQMGASLRQSSIYSQSVRRRCCARFLWGSVGTETECRECVRQAWASAFEGLVLGQSGTNRRAVFVLPGQDSCRTSAQRAKLRGVRSFGRTDHICTCSLLEESAGW